MKKSKLNDIIKYYIKVSEILFNVDKTYTFLLLLLALIQGCFPGILTIVLQKLLNSLQQVEISYANTVRLVLIYLGMNALIGILGMIVTFIPEYLYLYINHIYHKY